MFSRNIMRAVALASLSMAAFSTAAPIHLSAPVEETVSPRPVRRRRISQRHVGGRYRNKGPQAKPKKRSNMVHVSRRTRRKHRRAA